MFYTTIENQKRNDGSYGLLYDHFYEEEGKAPAKDRAYAKFYTICAAASLSDIPYHAAHIIGSNGMHEERIWDRTGETAQD